MLLSREQIKLSLDEKKLLLRSWNDDIINNTVTDLIYYQSGNYKIEGYISYPRVITERLPVIIWLRGGYKSRGSLDKFVAPGILGELANDGYFVLAPGYRNDDEFGGKEINDVWKLIEIASDFNECDINNTGIEGWSRGGMMAFKLMCSDFKFNCAVIISGLTDLKSAISYSDNIRQTLLSAFPEIEVKEDNESINQRSAYSNIDLINSHIPVLFIHGDNDDRINFKDSIKMFEAISKRNTQTHYKIEIISGGNHFLSEHKSTVLNHKINWYRRFLKK